MNEQEFLAEIDKINWAANIAKDNVFNADHRNEMIRKYEYTEAEFILIQDLV